MNAFHGVTLGATLLASMDQAADPLAPTDRSTGLTATRSSSVSRRKAPVRSIPPISLRETDAMKTAAALAALGGHTARGTLLWAADRLSGLARNDRAGDQELNRAADFEDLAEFPREIPTRRANRPARRDLRTSRSRPSHELLDNLATRPTERIPVDHR